ncbi:MAG: hypothetical protein RLZZ01_1633, partial [Actinomycetota bacterium]
DGLRLEDAIANGWTVDGPVLREGGGATIVLTHPFSSAPELANVLTSIGPPLTGMATARTVGEDGQVVNGINGVLTLPDGYGSFADADLLAAVGGVPFSEDISASGLSIEESFSFTYRVALPGTLESAATGTSIGDGVVQWVAPLDGSEVGLYMTTVQRPAGGGWAGVVATLSLVALVGWVVLASAFIAFVAIARRNKRRRREQRLRSMGRRRPEH